MPDHSVLKPHGTIIVTDPDAGTIVKDCLRCCHCQAVWVVVRGSGKRRGFCTKCMGPTCGSDECMACNPWEKRLERIEAGKPELPQ
ncbi:MAG TPA: hypothetical protein VK797_23185 [Tepidisphaeraceae bacterium]|jgi:hypothetical protein|nr:hypothetical protein [Tepidisphaeraceae bacterium]